MERYIDQLIKAGLTEYEAKTYYALLQKNDLTATEISKLAAVPRTRVYEVLNNLIQKGFCTSMNGKVRRYKAISPEYAFNDFIEMMDKDLQRRKQEIKSVSKDLLPIYEAEKDNSESIEYAHIIRERNHINEKMNEIGNNTREEIITFNKSPFAVNIPKLLKRGYVQYLPGLKYRFITEKSDLEDENYLRFMKLWQKEGAEIRVVEEVPVKMVIFDRKTIVINLPDKIKTTEQYTSMVIDHDDLAKFFMKIFSLYYKESIDLDEYLRSKRS